MEARSQRQTCRSNGLTHVGLGSERFLGFDSSVGLDLQLAGACSVSIQTRGDEPYLLGARHLA